MPGRSPNHEVARRSLRAVGSWIGLVAAVTVAAAALGAGRAATAQSPEELNAAEAVEAAQIYAIQCAQCHGSAGGGGVIDGRQVPPLRGRDGATVPYVDLVLRVGRMPPAGDPFDNRARGRPLDDRARELLVAYMREAFDLEGEVPEVALGDPARGRAVYATNCAACHGSTWAGGVAGAGAWTPAVTAYEPVVIAEAVRVGPFEMPRFDERQISDAELADVAAYLEEVAEERGTPLLGLVEVNPVYASGLVLLLVLAVVASLVWIAGRPTWFPDEPPASTGEASGEETP